MVSTVGNVFIYFTFNYESERTTHFNNESSFICLLKSGSAMSLLRFVAGGQWGICTCAYKHAKGFLNLRGLAKFEGEVTMASPPFYIFRFVIDFRNIFKTIYSQTKFKCYHCVGAIVREYDN